MRTIVRLCREIGVRVLNYLDDFLWAAKQGEENELVEFVLDLLTSLGWKLNEKGNLTPQHVAEFLGMTINTETYTVETPQRKMNEIKALAEDMKKAICEGRNIKMTDLQKLAGTIRATSIAVKAAPEWTREMNRWIARMENEGMRERNTQTTNTTELKNELDVWTEMERYNGAPIDNPEHQLTIYTDSGEQGWGGTCGTMRVAGNLPVEVIGKSSTKRELYGLRMMVQTEEMREKLRGKRVKVRMDSQAAVALLMRGGGQKDELNEEIKKWWKECEQNGIQATYEWIPREDNETADRLSKKNEFDCKITNMTERGREKASEFARKEGHASFITPSFNAITKTISDIIQDGREEVMIVPEWPAQAWWPKIMYTNVKAEMIGDSHEVYKTDERGYVKDMPKYKMWAVVIGREREGKQQ